jgi:acetyl esterase/lipase
MMNSLRFCAIEFVTRTVVKPWASRIKDPIEMRAAFERHAKRSHIHPPFSVYRKGLLGDISALWVSRGKAQSDDVLFYVHGGGFVAGSPKTHRHMVSYLAGELGIEAVMPQYRLAPEHPFPAGFDDVLAAYNGLTASGRKPQTIILGGDSAGGNLVLALVAHLSDKGAPMPQSMFVLSPAVNMASEFPSRHDNAKTEAILPSGHFDVLGAMVFGTQDRAQPTASPINAAFKTCPPILFHCCDGEILRDDTLEMQTKLVDLGHKVLVRSFPNGFHVFHLMYGYFPEAKQALDDVVSFIKQQRKPRDS